MQGWDDAVKWLLGAMGGLMAVLSWIGKRQVDRIDKLETGKANKESMDARFTSVLAQLDRHIDEDRSMHSSLGLKLDRLSEQLGETNKLLAGAVARIGMQSSSRQ